MNNGQDPVMNHTNLDFDTDKKNNGEHNIDKEKDYIYAWNIVLFEKM